MFPFEDRLALVEAGTSDLENVFVLKSGKFIISAFTMPEYFSKEECSGAPIDCSDDLLLFCNKIAPTLHITKRFAGQEPYCNITLQYNRQMQRILPEYGIKFIEIARLQNLGKAISASEVRALYAQRDFEKIGQLVPRTTLEYLLRRNERNE